MAEFTVYGRPSCPWCERAKGLLELNRHDFDYVDLTQHPEKRAELIASGATTVPQVYRNGTLIGGYEALLDHLEDRTLA